MGHELIITTPLFVLHYDTGTGRVGIIEEGRLEYYGVSWPADGSRLVMAHSVLTNYSGLSLLELVNVEVGTVSVGERTSDPCLAFPHQVLCQGNDHVLVTNTGRNALARFRLDDLSFRLRRYDRVMWDSLGPEHPMGSHFNSLYERDCTIYMLAHNNGRPSYVLELDSHTLDVKRTVHSEHYGGMHNIWVTDDGQYLACHSLAGSIIDIKTDSVVFSSGSDSFTRGMASDGNILFVGSSRRGDRETRHRSETGLFLIDLSRWKLIEYVRLGDFGNVKDVRLSNTTDLCHHGHLLRPSVVARRRDVGVPQGASTLTLGTSLDPNRWRHLIGSVQLDDDDRMHSFPRSLSVAVLAAPVTADVRIAAKLHAVGDGSGQHASLLARQSGVEQQGAAYAALFERRAAWIVSIWRAADGRWSKLCSAPATTKENIDVVFELRGSELSVSVDGQEVLRTSDGAVSDAGAVGVRLMGANLRISEFLCIPLS